MPADPPDDRPERVVGADRVLAVLVELANHPEGVTLEELTAILASSKSTVHRALGSLRRAKLASQASRGLYMLGDEFFHMAFRNQAARPVASRIEPALRELASTFSETAHFAVLEGAEVVYRAKVDPPEGAVRLTSVVGGRNPAYRTAVGKLLLAFEASTEDELKRLIGPQPLSAKTPKTIASTHQLWDALKCVQQLGYAVDDQENENGINCLAVPVFMDGSTQPVGAVSVSALAFRVPLAELVDRVDEIRELVATAVGVAGTAD